MFRLSAACVVLLTTSAFGAPVPRESMRPPIPVAGTVWEGDGVVAASIYEFHPDGRMTMSYLGTRHQNIGTWQQDGTRLYWETNGKYCEFEGTIRGTTMIGRAWNKPGGKWALNIKRKITDAGK